MISLNKVPPVCTRYLAVWVLRGDVAIWVEGMEAPACHRHAICVFALVCVVLGHAFRATDTGQRTGFIWQHAFGPVEQSPVNFLSNLFQLTGGSAERTLLITASHSLEERIVGLNWKSPKKVVDIHIL